MRLERAIGDLPPPGRPSSGGHRGHDRGTCPRCGSGEVTHVVHGLLAGPLDGPDWVVPGGCCLPAHDRWCKACGAGWDSAPGRGE